jgi:hypothetical protein
VPRIAVERTELVSRRFIVSGIAAAAIAGTAIPSLAQSLPITVTHDTSNGVSVGVQDGNAPVGGASVTPDGQACAGLGEDIPVCTPPVLDAVHVGTRQSLPAPPVTLRHDDNGTAVGVGDVGVVVSPSGRVCPVVSTQAWQCVGGN